MVNYLNLENKFGEGQSTIDILGHWILIILWRKIKKVSILIIVFVVNLRVIIVGLSFMQTNGW